jgi:L-seryl-tRNA(Ser) seleniumtransferase
MKHSITRRNLLRTLTTLGAGAAAAPAALAAQGRKIPAPAPAPPAPNVYEALGVKPLINGRGTFTIIGGSMELPEVREAKSLANQQYAHLDELMEAAGKRLAELTGAEWGMVSAGCAAAMSHATAACVAGGNPDLHVRIPNLAGFAKDEVIIPTHSRNVYDAASRAVGVKIIEVDSPEALQLAIGPKTAMIYIFAGPRTDSGPMSTESICNVARPLNVPVFVDAAAEILTIPNVHLQRGATLVGYSGGKYIRGPQSAGLLLGRKDLVRAAWVHSAPHHGYARAMKVGREEIVGMVVAVENWVKRDHQAEWKKWVARCDYIAEQTGKVAGVQAMVQREADEGLSNRSPRVTVRWNAQQLGLTGAEAADILLRTEPRIALNAAGRPQAGQPASGDTGIAVVTAMLADGDEKIVAQRISQVLSERRTAKPAETATAPAADLSGKWDIEITYAAGRSVHALHLQQRGARLEGLHQGDFLSRDITGTIDGTSVSLASSVAERHGDAITYRFKGTVHGDTMNGSLDMGEYLAAAWTAKRRA